MHAQTNSRRQWLVALALGLGLVAGCGKGEKQPDSKAASPGADQVLAKVGGKPIRQQDIDTVREAVPQFRQGEYLGARGTMRILDQLVERELIVQEATSQGLDRDPEVAKQLDEIRRNLLVQTYQRKMVDALPKPTDEQIKDYYDQHPQEFVMPARINASWILCATEAEANRARRRIVEKGEDFASVAMQVSIDDQTKRDGGLLGYFNPIGYIRSVGPDTLFARRAFELEVGDIGPVFPFKNGYAFIKVHEKTTERAEPFDRAKDRIRGRLTPTFSDSLLRAEVDRLRDKTKVEILLDVDAELADKSADDLMRMATESTNPQDKIDYYRALLRKYPTYARADEAQFMIGFVYSEELDDFERARPEFEKVLTNYPQSGIRESAQYMLQNMGRGASLPGFEEAAPNPDTPVEGR